MEFVSSSGARGLELMRMPFVAPVFAIVAYGLLIVLCLLFQSCFKRIPPEYREMAVIPENSYLLGGKDL